MTQADDTQFTDIVYALTSAKNLCFSAQASGLYCSEDQGKSWTSCYDELALTAPLPTLAVAVAPNFEREASLFAGVSGGILRSPDGGQHWERAFTPVPPMTVTAFCISPNYENDGQIFTSTLDDGVFYSRDRGRTWNAGNFGLLDLTVYALAISPDYAQDRLLFAGTQSGIFTSSNGGRSWKEILLPAENTAVLSLALSPDFERDRRVFVGTELRGLLSSSDAGKSWSSVAAGRFTEAINAVLLSPQYARQSEILVLHGDELLHSGDSGQSWELWREKLLSGKSISAVHCPQGFKSTDLSYVGLQDGAVIVAG